MFSIGDHVVCVKKYGMVNVGEVGRIVHIYTLYPEYGVEWENKGTRRHSCNGNSMDGHGYYVSEDSIRLLNPVDFGDILSDREVLIDDFLFGV